LKQIRPKRCPAARPKPLFVNLAGRLPDISQMGAVRWPDFRSLKAGVHPTAT
jgi:hypothetical protein